MGAGPMGLEVRAPVWRSRRGETESGSSRAKKVEPVMEIRAALLTCSHKRPLLLLPLPCSADSLFIPAPHIFLAATIDASCVANSLLEFSHASRPGPGHDHSAQTLS